MAVGNIPGKWGSMRQRKYEWLFGRLLPIIYVLRRAGWWILRPVTLGVRTLVVDGDRVLLVRQHGIERWHLPGGAVERGELLADAARREVLEESGCRIEIDRLLGVYGNFSEQKSDHSIIFVAHPLSPIDVPLNIEIAEARYFPIAALPPQLNPYVRRRLDDYAAGTWGMHGPW